MICCTCEQVDGWKIARNSGAKIFLDEEVITHMTLSYEINSLVICCKFQSTFYALLGRTNGLCPE